MWANSASCAPVDNQCHLVFSNLDIAWWGRPLACAGRFAPLLDKFNNFRGDGHESRTDGISDPSKLSDIGLTTGIIEIPRIVESPIPDLKTRFAKSIFRPSSALKTEPEATITKHVNVQSLMYR